MNEQIDRSTKENAELTQGIINFRSQLANETRRANRLQSELEETKRAHSIELKQAKLVERCKPWEF